MNAKGEKDYEFNISNNLLNTNIKGKYKLKTEFT